MSEDQRAAAWTALVTGASSGIGRHIALEAAARCATLVLVARRRRRLDELAAEIAGRHPGVDLQVRPADLGEPAERERLLAALEADGVQVDWLVNAAGFGVAGRADETDAGRLAAMVELNVAALQHLTLALLPGMVRRRRGGVLNVASTAAYQPLPYMATYAATKSFVLSFSEALWQELRGTGVVVTCLCPGRTKTEFFDDANMDDVAFTKTPAASPAAVAAAGWRGLMAGRRVVVPGFANALGAWCVPLLPKRPVLWSAAKLFKP